MSKLCNIIVTAQYIFIEYITYMKSHSEYKFHDTLKSGAAIMSSILHIFFEWF